MRTTLDIDDDVLAAAKELARLQGASAGQVVSDLMRRALTGPLGTDKGVRTGRAAKPVGGFRPFKSRGSPVTNAAIDRLRDIEGA